MSYESMNLLDDALRQYEQLHASFLHVVREKNLSWFGALIVPSPKDDSTPLLSVTRKSYQDLILANTISVFDLQIYMLAREAALLAKVNKLTEVCRMVHKFLVAFGRQLWDVEVRSMAAPGRGKVLIIPQEHSPSILYRILDVLLCAFRCRAG
jgi:hypothetical protein